MMAISTKGRYSVRILVLMAGRQPGHVFTKHEIGDQEGISSAYVQQLMMTLHATGFVTSHRGKAGGFTLAKPPETMTVADVLSATEGQILPVPCLGVEQCEREPHCPTRPMWMKAAELLDDLFSGVTIAALAANGTGGAQLPWQVGDPGRDMDHLAADLVALADGAPRNRPFLGFPTTDSAHQSAR